MSREIEGEILLTTRRFYSSASVCPDRLVFSESDSDDEPDPSVPVDHETKPMAPIDEPSLAAMAVAHAELPPPAVHGRRPRQDESNEIL